MSILRRKSVSLSRVFELVPVGDILQKSLFIPTFRNPMVNWNPAW